MGSFYVADTVTGRALTEGVPVVAFILNHNMDVYPLDDNKNEKGLWPTHYFAPVSLPIYGTYDDGGQIEVDDPNQLAVRIALTMTGCKTWDELSEKAFDDQEGVQFMGVKNGTQLVSFRGTDHRRVYGLCIMHRDTYDYLLNIPFAKAPQAPAERKAADIALVKGLIADAIEEQKTWGKGENLSKEELRRSLQFDDLSQFQTNHYQDKDGKRIKLPFLAQALQGEGDAEGVGDDFIDVLNLTKLTGFGFQEDGKIQSVADFPELDELLSGLYDLKLLRIRMTDVHTHFYPSFYAGQEQNDAAILGLNLVTLQSTGSDMIRYLEENGEEQEQFDAVRDHIAAIEEVAQTLRKRLREAQARFDEWQKD